MLTVVLPMPHRLKITKMKGYNLPDNVSPSDPEAPWNKEEQEPTCIICGSTEVVKSILDEDFCEEHLPEEETS